MQIEELMTKDVKTCNRGTNLAKAASFLWEADCGVLPVVDDNGIVTGMISDRDICIAVVTQGRLASEIAVGEVTAGMALFTCHPSQLVTEALEIMRENQVRRLPVLNEERRLCGILSLSDVLLEAPAVRSSENTALTIKVVETLKAICAPYQKDVASEQDKMHNSQAAQV